MGSVPTTRWIRNSPLAGVVGEEAIPHVAAEVAGGATLLLPTQNPPLGSTPKPRRFNTNDAEDTRPWIAVGTRPLALFAPAPLVMGAVEALAQQEPKTPSSPLMVMRAGPPLAGQEASANRTATHCAPIRAFLRASWRRYVAQFRKFPSQSAEPQAVVITAFVVVAANLLFVWS